MYLNFLIGNKVNTVLALVFLLIGFAFLVVAESQGDLEAELAQLEGDASRVNGEWLMVNGLMVDGRWSMVGEGRGGENSSQITQIDTDMNLSVSIGVYREGDSDRIERGFINGKI